MNLFKNADPRAIKALKIASIALLAVVVLGLAASLIGVRRVPAFMNGGWSSYAKGGGAAYDYAVAPMYEEPMARDAGMALSVRNVAPIMPQPGYSMGNDAEWYEVTEYGATIESGNAKETCAEVLALKDLEYVVFESSSSYEKGCMHVFKVEHAHVPEALAAIEALDPRDLSQNVHTIKQAIDDFTSEEEILEKKLAAVEETLEGALKAYDSVTSIATRAGDAAALAKVIDSKIGTIERLTQERIAVGMQLERISRAKEIELDRLEYTYFNVNVFESSVVDGSSLKDSWRASVQELVRTLNKVVQDLTVGVVALALLIVQYAVYALILVLVAKYGWQAVRKIWNK